MDMTRKLILAAWALLFAAAVPAQQKEEFRLWPEAGKYAPERLGAGFDRDNAPYVTLYRPEGKKPAPAVVVCPGGAYGGLAIGHEGYQVAEWFAARGFAAVVLKYTMAPRQLRPAPPGRAAGDRAGACECGRVGRRPCAGRRHRLFGRGTPGLDGCDALHLRCEPSRFRHPGLPVITMDERFTHAGSRRNLLGEAPAEGLVAAFSNELRVTSGTPPTFIAFSDDDDGVPPVNGTLFYNALKAASVPGEIHIYPTGGHGWGWNETFKYKDEFRNSLVRWLSERLGE